MHEITGSPNSSTSSRNMLVKHNKLGHRNEGFKVSRTIDKLPANFLNCRYYRLNDNAQRRSSRETSRTKSFKDKLELVLKDRRFDGTDGIFFFEFLRSLVREANVAAMSEAHLYLGLRRILKKSAHEHFVALRGCSAQNEGGVSSWPEAVQYMFRA